MADQISEAQRLLKEIEAKYGAPAAGNPQPAQPQPQPQPQAPKQEPAKPGSMIQKALGIFGDRGKQIDKAAGYACGGKVKSYGCGGKMKAHAQGGKISGPGTSTSDSIPGKVKETGEPILVSNNERIVSAKQEQLLERIAQMLGFETVDQMFEQMTGTPVGPTMKGGKQAAVKGSEPGAFSTNNDAEDEYTKSLQNRPSVVAEMLPNTAKSWAQSGKDINAAMQNGNYANAFGLSLLGTGKALANVVNDVVGNPVRQAAPVVKDVASGAVGNVKPAENPATPAADPTPGSSMVKTDPFGPTPGMGILPGQKQPGAQFMTGAEPGVAPKPVPVLGRDDNGIITAESAAAAANSPMTRSGGIYGTMDMKGANEILARENQARGEMIDSMIKAQGGNGINVLGDENAQDRANAETTDRWRRDDLLQKLARASNRSDKSALTSILNNESSVAAQMRGQDISAASQKYSADVSDKRAAGHDSVLMRGQDLNAQTHLAQIAGNPLDQRIKAAQLNESETTAALRGRYLDPNATPEQRAASLEQLRGISGKLSEDNKPWAHVVGGGVNPDTGQMNPQYLVTGRADKVTNSITGADAAKKPQQIKPMPSGYTADKLIAEAKASGKDPAAIAARLAEYGIKYNS